MTAPLTIITTGEMRRKKLLAELHRIIGLVKHEHGDHIAGYALVTWDHRGGAFVATNTALGPVSKHLAASFCAEQIGRIATVDDAHNASLLTVPTKPKGP